MVAIVNIDPNPRESGLHLYSIRINAEEVGRTRHFREEPLSKLLFHAYVSVGHAEEQEKEATDD